MIRPGIIFFGFAAVFAASFGAMRLWTMPVIAGAAGGLPMFDLLLDGYTAEYGRSYMGRLEPAGRAAYLGAQRVLDTIMPMALTGALGLGGFLAVVRWSWRLGILLALVPLAYFAFDMLENAQVAAILQRGVVRDTMVENASRFTVLKGVWLQIAIAVAVFAGLVNGLDRLLGKVRRHGLHGRD